MYFSLYGKLSTLFISLTEGKYKRKKLFKKLQKKNKKLSMLLQLFVCFVLLLPLFPLATHECAVFILVV